MAERSHRRRLRVVAVLAVTGLAASGALGGVAHAKTTKKARPAAKAAAKAKKPAAVQSTTTTTEKPSGTITVYSGRNEALVKPILDQFTQDTGIKVAFRTGDSGALASQILTEGKATRADVFFSQDAGALGAVSKAGLFDELPKSILSRVGSTYSAKDGRWVGVSGRVRVIIYNPLEAGLAPSTIDDVLDSRWRGRIGYAPTNASWQSFVTGLRVIRGESAARQWLVKFKANDPRAYSSNGAVRDAVNTREVAIGLINHYYLFEKITAEGEAKVIAKNQYLPEGDPGGLVNVAGVGVLNTSTNKPAALALAAYLLGDKAQDYFAKKTYEYPLVSSVAPSVHVPRLSELKPPALDLSELDSLAKTQQLLRDTGLLT